MKMSVIVKEGNRWLHCRCFIRIVQPISTLWGLKRHGIARPEGLFDVYVSVDRHCTCRGGLHAKPDRARKKNTTTNRLQSTVTRKTSGVSPQVCTCLKTFLLMNIFLFYSSVGPFMNVNRKSYQVHNCKKYNLLVFPLRFVRCCILFPLCSSRRL